MSYDGVYYGVPVLWEVGILGGCWALFFFIALSSCWMGHTIYFADGETSRSRFGVFELK